MARPVTQLHPPRDFAEPDPTDEYDPTGYYHRKQIHREEMLPYLAALFVAFLACVAVAWAWNLVT